ncbi:PREDICTED: uncharacterized protein LOC106306765 isoform X2 [Brassica oleracea var. oleracea]|uniref:uncharacterized protein LOC106306765 isoform X2 n=1 Tax=Brassica oleracea var. oleracea TaxID=109376 RepID=UPI0006A6BE27|nr:PREDICTED: uncharacterized protein LOC106306765 isoform X2 [Brassica oleracea var. oleracea]XP_013598964.1 PREDICTED: uncharacterized protein LOC106306765 isoform X2 [Brassica oleracea var. oleracea]
MSAYGAVSRMSSVDLVFLFGGLKSLLELLGLSSEKFCIIHSFSPKTQRQIRALLEGHELHHFLDAPAPLATIVVDGTASPNPDYAPWRRQDRLLYSAIIGAISLPVQPVMSSAMTTADVWNILASTYGNPTRGHIRQLKFQIKTTAKGTKTISEYLRIIKSKADELGLLGKPLDPEDLTEQILAGLSEDYKPEIDAINGRDNPISFAELHERLLNREAMILCSEAPPTGPITANATDTRPRQNWKSNNNNSRSNYTASPQFNKNRNTRPYLGRCQVGSKDIVLRIVQSSVSFVALPLPLLSHGHQRTTPDRGNHSHSSHGDHKRIMQCYLPQTPLLGSLILAPLTI